MLVKSCKDVYWTPLAGVYSGFCHKCPNLEAPKMPFGSRGREKETVVIWMMACYPPLRRNELASHESHGGTEER